MNIQDFKTWKFCTFFYFCGSFFPSWIRIQQLKLMRIRIRLRNPAAPPLFWTFPGTFYLITNDQSNLRDLKRWAYVCVQGGGFSSVLRPSDLYPVEPVVLRHRPRSQISNRSNISHRLFKMEFFWFVASIEPFRAKPNTVAICLNFFVELVVKNLYKVKENLQN